MFSGDSAFAVMFEHKTEPAVPPRPKNPRLSQSVSDVIERCVAKSPRNRFSSFREIAALLNPPTDNNPSPWSMDGDEGHTPHIQKFQECRTQYLSKGSSFDDAFLISSGRELRVVRGDILQQMVDAIVSSDDESLSMSGGISEAIRVAGGKDVQEDAHRFVPVRQGRVVVTTAGMLPQRFVFHGVTIDYSTRTGGLPGRDVIAEIINSCFYEAETLNVQSIAFPLLGTGAGGFSREVCLETMFRVLVRQLLLRPTCVKDVRIVIF